MYEEAASSSASLLKQLLKEGCNENEIDVGEFSDMLESAGMVFVQSLNQLGRCVLSVCLFYFDMQLNLDNLSGVVCYIYNWKNYGGVVIVVGIMNWVCEICFLVRAFVLVSYGVFGLEWGLKWKWACGVANYSKGVRV